MQVHEQLVMVGGWDGADDVSEAHIFDLKAREWRQCEADIRRHAHTVEQCNDGLLLIGGCHNDQILSLQRNWIVEPFPRKVLVWGYQTHRNSRRSVPHALPELNRIPGITRLIAGGPWIAAVAEGKFPSITVWGASTKTGKISLPSRAADAICAALTSNALLTVTPELGVLSWELNAVRGTADCHLIVRAPLDPVQAASRLQRVWRGASDRARIARHLRQTHSAAISIQCVCRAVRTIKHLRESSRRRRRNEAAMQLQALARGHDVRRSIPARLARAKAASELGEAISKLRELNSGSGDLISYGAWAAEEVEHAASRVIQSYGRKR